MMELKFLRQHAEETQTTLDNVIREYFQHLFLSLLYQEKGSEHLFFKGGTTLRLVWQSPRFSEDLDFSGKKLSLPQIETMMEAVLVQMEKQGIETEIEESKKTSGGYLAIFGFQGAGYESGIQVEVSLRTPSKVQGKTSLIHSPLIPPYTLIHLEEKDLVREKIQACLTRGKPRDYFDLYFILRSRMALQDVFGKDKTLKERLLKAIGGKRLDLRRELKQFLPVSHHGLLKDFKSILLNELERNIP